MKNNDKIKKTIPIGELKCIWMTAGVVDYKLCDKNYSCDSCEYYNSVRKGISEITESKSNNEYIKPMNQNIEEKILDLLNNASFIDGLLYKENHTWVKVIDPYKVKVGLDSFAGRLLPKNKVIVLPVLGHIVYKEKPCAWVAIGDEIFTIKSPITGIVIEVNNKLITNSVLLNNSPYEEGWMFCVKPIKLKKDLGKLYSVNEIISVVKQDIDKIKRKVAEGFNMSNYSVGTTMMDGGVNINDLSDILGQKKFSSILDCIFKFIV